MEAKHTPGPWRIGRPSVMNGVQIFRDYDFPARVETICTMPDKGKGRTANARLIAAAPDLLAALEAVREMCIPGMNWTDEIGQELLRIADDALAKAKGD